MKNIKFNTKGIFIVMCCLTFLSSSQTLQVKISSLEALAKYAALDNHTVTMTPGVYKLTDYLPMDSMKDKREKNEFQFITFSGNNNIFNLDGVVIEVDTELRTALKPPIHTNEFVISGSNNTISGLEIKYFGSGTSPGGAALEVAGESNILNNITLRVTGSFPYGYGDLFGKGGPDVIRHQKHSGLLVTGSYSKIIGCKLYMKSFGHGFFVQKNAENVHFEDCYVEGELRKTEEILAETSGPAFDVQFRTWTQNRDGEYVVTPGYMKSLCEDGFRTYGSIKNISFKNCTAKNTRGGFELRTNEGILLENCTTIGTERAFWVGNNAKMINCKGDANYGPLLFAEGSNLDVELFVVNTESDRKVHALVTVQGGNSKIILKPYKGLNRKQPLPIIIGSTPPMHGESMSPFSKATVTNLSIVNETEMPIVIGMGVSNSTIVTVGLIAKNSGENIKATILDK